MQMKEDSARCTSALAGSSQCAWRAEERTMPDTCVFIYQTHVVPLRGLRMVLGTRNGEK